MRVQQHGLALDLPAGWEGRIYRREPAELPEGRARTAEDEDVNPVLHAGNFALPEDRGDFGSGALEVMRASHVFFSLVEYGPDSVGTALFAAAGPPWPLDPAAFSPTGMMRVIPGLSGAQFFFTHGERAFCLFAVLGSHVDRRSLVAQRLNPGLQGLAIDQRGGR